MYVGAAPWELGPEVFAAIICWRIVSSAVVVVYSVNTMTAMRDTWLSLEMALGACGAAIFFCVGGLLLFFGSLDDEFDKTRLWRPQSGKQYFAEEWDAQEVWAKGCPTKEAERFCHVGNWHPMHLPFVLMTSGLEELANKYGGEEGEEKPEWLDASDFPQRVRGAYSWKNDLALTARAEAALRRLFPSAAAPPPTVDSNKNTSKIAPSTEDNQ